MQDRRGKLSLFLPDPGNDFVHALAADATEAAKRLGFTLSVQFSANQAVEQIQQAFAALRAPEGERPLAVLAMPVHDPSLERVARAAAAAGIGWICLHRMTGDLEALRQEYPAVPLFLVAPDQEEIGRIQGREMMSMFPQGANVLYVQGRSDNLSTTQRAAGLREVIEGSRVVLADVIDGNWSASDTERMVGRWLRLLIAHTPIDIVTCQNDAMAMGAMRALREAATALGRPALAQLPIIGCDGLPGMGRKLVDSGELAATIVLPMAGSVAIEQFAQALDTGKMPPLRTLLAPRAYRRTAGPRATPAVATAP
jgi:ABC-type sugar transport system substrate-binding protein